MIQIMISAPFSSLPPSALKPLTVPKGGLLFRQGDPARALLLILTGEVALLRHGAEGNTVPLAHAGAGETVAEASLFSDTYHCDCVALAPTSALGIAHDAVRVRIAEDTAFSTALIERLSRQVQQQRRRLEIVAIRSAEARVLAALAEFGQPGSVTAFARGIALTPEATYRALSALCRRGRVERVGRGRYRAM